MLTPIIVTAFYSVNTQAVGSPLVDTIIF